jgi:release factor glutamine methyltransferase
MAMEDDNISISTNTNTPDHDIVKDHEILDVDMLVEDEDDETSFGVPKIKVIRKNPEMDDWCIIQLSRGIGPRALLQWITANEDRCFSPLEAMDTNESETDSEDDPDQTIQTPPPKRIGTKEIKPVLANPHYSAYAKSLVLVARNRNVLKQLISLRVTVHCLVKGYQKPRSELLCRNEIAGGEYRTRAVALAVAPSNTAGHISLLSAYNDDMFHPSIAPRQFRRHLKSMGYPVLGNAKDAYSFRGEALCMSMVRLEFSAAGISKVQCVCIPPTPKLNTLMQREERFWRERRGQEEVRIQLFSDGIEKPPEYVAERATFDGLEFKVTPAVMIPRKGSQTIVDRAVFLYENSRSTVTHPAILDLGTGCGSLLISILSRLLHHYPYGVGFDASREALEVAAYNIAALGHSRTARTIQGRFADLQSFDGSLGPFNIIVCNPPYHTKGGRKRLDACTVSHEPDAALFVDIEDYLIHYRHVLRGLAQAKNLVAPGAILIFEVFRDNAESISKLMSEAGLEDVAINTDCNGCIRTAEGIFPRPGIIEI